jgi:hypothetical protein
LTIGFKHNESGIDEDILSLGIAGPVVFMTAVLNIHGNITEKKEIYEVKGGCEMLEDINAKFISFKEAQLKFLCPFTTSGFLTLTGILETGLSIR